MLWFTFVLNITHANPPITAPNLCNANNFPLIHVILLCQHILRRPDFALWHVSVVLKYHEHARWNHLDLNWKCSNWDLQTRQIRVSPETHWPRERCVIFLCCPMHVSGKAQVQEIWWEKQSCLLYSSPPGVQTLLWLSVLHPKPPCCVEMDGSWGIKTHSNTHTLTREHVAGVLRHSHYHGVADGLVLITWRGGSSERLWPCLERKLHWAEMTNESRREVWCGLTVGVMVSIGLLRKGKRENKLVFGWRYAMCCYARQEG